MSESADNNSHAPGQSGWKPGMGTSAPGRSTGAGSDHSLIGPTVVIRGEVTAEEDLVVMGRIEGFIDHSQTITIHAEGTVAAEVKAEEVLIEGTVDGNVYGTRRVQIAETGTVNGNVFAPRVGVLEGASFKGAIDMNADIDAIERRFREQTGSEPRSTSGSAGAAQAKTAASNKASENTSVDAKGESDAAQAHEKGHSENATGSDSKHGHQ